MAQLGTLIAVLDFHGVAQNEFNDWYDTEHIPERRRVPGFLSVQRWLSADGEPLSIATYDLQSLDVLASAPYRAIAGDNFSPWSKSIIGRCKRFWRYEAVQILPGDRVSPEGAGALLFFGMNVDPDAEDDFNRWYDTEHVPNLAKVPGVLAARRYRSVVGEHKYVALYHLESPDVASSEPWSKAIETPWTHRIRPKTRDRMRIVCKRYERPAAAA
jgi:hypothetical protein